MQLTKWMFLLVLLSLLTPTSCDVSATKKNRVIVVQPLGSISSSLVQNTWDSLKLINPNILINQVIPLPPNAYYKARNRYRADTLIRYLATLGNDDTVVIGFTSQDISTTKNNIADWGIMGLGYRPGNACIVSSFRLSKSNVAKQFYKVALHELGHTEGLPHCPVKTCLMRNAEGGNPLDQEHDFCSDCKAFLIKKGWKIK